MLQGKNVFITGARGGIGRALVEEFAKSGANIITHLRQPDDRFQVFINKIIEKYKVKISCIYFDMTDYDSMKENIIKLRKNKVRVDILVNNAGISENSLFVMTTEEMLRKQFEVNFFSVFLFTQQIIKIMIKQKFGRIINISSAAALDSNPGKSVYGASKAAIIAMTNSISSEYGTYNITANCLAPGIIQTNMIESMSNEIIEKTTSLISLKRRGVPYEVASAAVFLSSDGASFINGQTIRIDGGISY